MEQVRFLRESIMTGEVADLELDEWSYDETLNRPGSLSAKVALTSPHCTEEILDPYRTAIYAVRGTNVEWGGILSPPSLSIGSSTLDVNCFGWTGYWDHRTIRKDYAPSATDQFSIFKHLVDDAQDEVTFGDGYDLGIDVIWDALSGVLRDRSDDYRPWKAKKLGEALQQLAAVEDGFDYAFEYTLNATTDRIDKAIKLFFPTKGRDTQFLFEYERGKETNIISYGFADPVTFAWVGDGWGEGTDALRIKSPYVDETLRGVYPPYDAAPSWSDVSEQSTLDEHTEETFGRTNRPRRVPVVRVDPNAYPQWGDYTSGDTANFRIIDSYGSTGITPQRNRTTGRKVTWDGLYDLVLADLLGSADTTIGA